eukprot:scaffold43542_cov51-Cyclotella_meneghiniana.AAC.7
MPTQVLSGVRGASCEKISHLADCPLEQSCRLPDARLLTHLIFISVDCGTTSITCPAVNFLVRQATGHIYRINGAHIKLALGPKSESTLSGSELREHNLD